jgi:GTP-binding protein EngB required for normal cell division
MERTTTQISLHGIRERLQTIRDAGSRFQMVSLAHQLEVAEGILSQNPPIDVAILGQFKAGKSSFINSLIGQNVLPVGAIPVTTAITRLQYGGSERAVVRRFDGSSTEVPLAEIADYTSEARNPGNERNVEVVDIELPTLEDYAGLRLVDTPGMGSVFKYHKSTSENWLPEVGAALLAVSSDRPLSEHDLELIRELTRHTPNIILLLTKADLLSPEQQQEVIQFFRETLRRELNRDLPVYLYSTRQGTQRYKQIVEMEILDRLAVNRDFEFKRILQHKTQSLARSCLNYLDIALKTSLQADLDREGLRAQILNEKVNKDLIREEMGMISRENQRQTRSLLQAYLDQYQKPVTVKVIAGIKKDMPSWKGNLWTLSRRYEAWMSEIMTQEMQRISRSEQQYFFGSLKKAHASLGRSLEAFRQFLAENIQRVLGIRLADVEWKIDVVQPDHPDISSTKSFSIHLDLIWFLIPMFIFRPVFEKRFVRGVPREVEINLSRLATQWEKRINHAIEEMKRQAVSYIEEELSTIEALLSETHCRTDDIHYWIARLQKQSGDPTS